MATKPPFEPKYPPDPCRTEDCDNDSLFGFDCCRDCHAKMMEELWQVLGWKNMKIPT
jgi:hypothetical protein